MSSDCADRYRALIDELDVAVRTPIPQPPPPQTIDRRPPPEQFNWAALLPVFVFGAALLILLVLFLQHH